jgi:hypothetical protein
VSKCNCSSQKPLQVISRLIISFDNKMIIYVTIVICSTGHYSVLELQRIFQATPNDAATESKIQGSQLDEIIFRIKLPVEPLHYGRGINLRASDLF